MTRPRRNSILDFTLGVYIGAQPDGTVTDADTDEGKEGTDEPDPR